MQQDVDGNERETAREQLTNYRRLCRSEQTQVRYGTVRYGTVQWQTCTFVLPLSYFVLQSCCYHTVIILLSYYFHTIVILFSYYYHTIVILWSYYHQALVRFSCSFHLSRLVIVLSSNFLSSNMLCTALLCYLMFCTAMQNRPTLTYAHCMRLWKQPRLSH